MDGILADQVYEKACRLDFSELAPDTYGYKSKGQDRVETDREQLTSSEAGGECEEGIPVVVTHEPFGIELERLRVIFCYERRTH